MPSTSATTIDGTSLDSCPSCSADLFPSTTFVWHWPDEDCRGVKDPYSAQQFAVYATTPLAAPMRAEDPRFS